VTRSSIPFGRLPGLAVFLAALAASAPSLAQFTDVTDEATQLPAPGITFGLGWADFDDNGHADAFVCRHWLRPIIFENDGTELSYRIFQAPFDPPEDHHGALIADIDEDGDPDIYLTAGADAGASEIPKKMYRNDGNLVFTNVAAEWGLEDALARGRSPSGIDLEGDGDLDIFVAKAARDVSPNSLFLQGGSLQFTDIAASAGVDDAFGSVGGLWGDYDNDGDPDLFIGGEEEVSFQTRLYRNEGNLTFTDVTQSVLPGIGQVAAAAWGDADNDGDLDLAVGLGDRGLFDSVVWSADSIRFFFNTRFGDNGLDGFAFQTSGDSATFRLAIDGFFQPANIYLGSASSHPTLSPFTRAFDDIPGSPSFTPGASVAMYAWTVSLADLWQFRANAPPTAGHSFAGIVTTNGSFTEVPVVALEEVVPGPRGTQLWRNDGGVFTEIGAAAGLGVPVNSHYLDWVDVDQDGWLDLYAIDKGDTELLNEPNVFYRNQGDGTFADETAAWSLEGPTAGLGDAFAFEDFDEDGDLDVMMTSGSGPKFIADQEHVRLYRNDGVVGNRLRLKLVGSLSTRAGYGAWVTCVTADGPQHRYVTGNTWRGGSTMLDPYFGLGAHTSADAVVVEWPSGIVDVYEDVPAGLVTLEEGFTVTEAPVSPAGALRLAIRSRPQPSWGPVTLSVSGRSGLPATLRIYDATGRRVLSREIDAGADRVQWDGRNGDGRGVGAGIYFVRITEGSRQATTKIVRLSR
jgi:hypothetical protein